VGRVQEFAIFAFRKRCFLRFVIFEKSYAKTSHWRRSSYMTPLEEAAAKAERKADRKAARKAERKASSKRTESAGDVVALDDVAASPPAKRAKTKDASDSAAAAAAYLATHELTIHDDSAPPPCLTLAEVGPLYKLSAVDPSRLKGLAFQTLRAPDPVSSQMSTCK
jgi:hypothetical protein